MFYTIKGLKVKIDNAALTFGGQAWFKGLLPRVEELKIQGMIDHGRSTVAISQVGFLPIIAVAAHIYTNPNPTQIGNWAAQKLTVTGTNNSALRTALLDFTNDANLVHYWAKIKLNAHPEGAGLKIKVDRGNHNDLDCHYNTDLTKKELVVKVPNNYMNSDPCAILGGMLFEAHNARNGQNFRATDAAFKAKQINHIERASKYIAIESDTYFKSTLDYVDIIKKGGHIGPQEFRNILAVGSKLGLTGYPWVLDGNAMIKFAISPHNPNLAGLNASTFATYIKHSNKNLRDGLISGSISNLHKTMQNKQSNLAALKTHIGYNHSITGSDAVKYFKRLYCVLTKQTPQNSQEVLDWFKKWRLPGELYDMAVGNPNTVNITDIACPDTQTLKNTVTITPLEFYTAYHV